MANGDEGRGQPLAYGEYREKLTAQDTDGKPAVLTIVTAGRKNLAPRGQSPEWKVAISFDEVRDAGGNPKELVLNATDYSTVCRYLGSDDRNWPGKKVVVAPTTTTYGGRAYEKMHIAAPERWDALVAQQPKKSK